MRKSKARAIVLRTTSRGRFGVDPSTTRACS